MILIESDGRVSFAHLRLTDVTDVTTKCGKTFAVEGRVAAESHLRFVCSTCKRFAARDANSVEERRK